MKWRPSRQALTSSQMAEFLEFVNRRYDLQIKQYFDLHRWSIEHIDQFWDAMWVFMDIVAWQPAERIYVPSARMQETQWFTGAKLNFAENLLRYRDDHPAL